MPIDKLGEEEKPLSVEIEAAGMPEIEIVLEEDGGATIEMGEEEADEVDFYSNLAEVIDEEENDVRRGGGREAEGEAEEQGEKPEHDGCKRRPGRSACRKTSGAILAA